MSMNRRHFLTGSAAAGVAFSQPANTVSTAVIGTGNRGTYLLRGVIETIVKESELLDYLPFMDVTGTSVTYNRETTMPAASFYDVGDTWTEATPTFTQVTAALKVLGGDADPVVNVPEAESLAAIEPSSAVTRKW